jgi:hypothetical protein
MGGRGRKISKKNRGINKKKGKKKKKKNHARPRRARVAAAGVPRPALHHDLGVLDALAVLGLDRTDVGITNGAAGHHQVLKVGAGTVNSFLYIRDGIFFFFFFFFFFKKINLVLVAYRCRCQQWPGATINQRRHDR